MKIRVDTALSLSLCCFKEDIWKRTSRAICWYKIFDSGPSDRLILNVFLGWAGVCQQPPTFWSVTLQSLGADPAAIQQMKEDIRSFHMRHESLIWCKKLLSYSPNPLQNIHPLVYSALKLQMPIKGTFCLPSLYVSKVVTYSIIWFQLVTICVKIARLT